MGNKFKQGDVVRVVSLTTDGSEFYDLGHVGVYSGDGWVDFKNQGNTFVNDDGFWNVLEENMKLYKEPESFLVWQHNSEYMNEEQKEALRALLRRVQWDVEYKDKIAFTDDTEIDGVMDWNSTDEGVDFWDDVYNQVSCAARPHNPDDPIVSKVVGWVVDEAAHKSALATQEGGVHYKKCGIQPVKSDGGSSSYYTISLPAKAIERINKNGSIELEDVLRYGFGNDFDFSNAVKSLMRLYGTVNGAGKEGNDVQYELNKIKYSLNKIEDFYG